MVGKIGVIGGGIMGSGIAQVAAQAGYQVVIRDVEEKYLQQALNTINKSLGIMKQKGKLTSEQADQILGRIRGTLELKQVVSDANLIIEAVPEDLELKKQVFKELDEICPRDTVLATNTSSLSITTLASVTSRPEKVIGMHFSNPVTVMMGVEVIKGKDTSDETLEVVKEVSEKMGKKTFVVQDFPGFAGNRILPLIINEAFYLLWERIISPEDLDELCKTLFRWPMGPCELGDLVGLDTILSILEYLHKEVDDKYRPCPLLKQAVAAGHLGRKSGRGIYEYSQ